METWNTQKQRSQTFYVLCILFTSLSKVCSPIICKHFDGCTCSSYFICLHLLLHLWLVTKDQFYLSIINQWESFLSLEMAKTNQNSLWAIKSFLNAQIIILCWNYTLWVWKLAKQPLSMSNDSRIYMPIYDKSIEPFWQVRRSILSAIDHHLSSSSRLNFLGADVRIVRAHGVGPSVILNLTWTGQQFSIDIVACVRGTDVSGLRYVEEVGKYDHLVADRGMSPGWPRTHVFSITSSRLWQSAISMFCIRLGEKH